ncbi:FAD-dependent oxidoreductase [Streptomyces sp. NPDC048527]|uniref:FAD-dependent oxidoreductase n=1 Tax=Streptomyces sp. NPDC048527 TaxID=3365568 RepID=UPI003711FD61
MTDQHPHIGEDRTAEDLMPEGRTPANRASANRAPEDSTAEDGTTYDVLVCGAGVAGLAAARALGDLGLHVLLLDKQRAPRDIAKGEVLQPGALRVLRRWGTEQLLCERGAVGLDRLVVRSPDGAALMALDYGQLPEGDRSLLAHDHAEILRALAEGLPPTVEIRRGTLVREALREPDGRVTGLVLTSDRGSEGDSAAGPDDDAAGHLAGQAGRTVRAPLVVAADGISSRLRRAAGIGGKRVDYPHRLVSVELTRSDEGTRTGPVPGDFSAYLTHRGLRLVYPLPRGRVRLYLQTEPDELRGLGGARFTAWLQEAVAEVPALAGFGWALAEGAGSRQVFSVSRYLAERFAAPGLALVGEAGYAVHPMAAQGMNTAITSAASLADRLAPLLPAAGGGRPMLDAATVDAALDAYEAERRPFLASAAKTSANAARMVTDLAWPGRVVGRRAVRCTGANPRLLHIVTHNMAGLGPRPLTPLDRLQQIGLLPDPHAHRVPVDH